MALLTAFFSFVGREKTKKRGTEEAGGQELRRAGGWGAAGPGGEDAGMMEAVPVVLVVVVGASTIKVYLYTTFLAVCGGGVGYFCTVSNLHRLRRWIGSRGRGADGSQVARLAGGQAGTDGRAYPPRGRYGWDDIWV